MTLVIQLRIHILRDYIHSIIILIPICEIYLILTCVEERVIV